MRISGLDCSTCSEQLAVLTKHCAIDLATKIALIDAVEAGIRSKTDVAKVMPKSTLSYVVYIV